MFAFLMILFISTGTLCLSIVPSMIMMRQLYLAWLMFVAAVLCGMNIYYIKSMEKFF